MSAEQIGHPAEDEPGTAGHVAFLVVGSARSGTTLVQRLICELPGVKMPPETHFFSQFAAGLLARRSFPLDTEQLSEELASFAASKSSRGLDIDADAVVSDLAGACDGPFALFDALVRRISGPAEMWGEKTPDHLLWWRPIARSAPWMRFVAVVRDPRAVVASNIEMPWRDDQRMPAWGDQIHLAFAERWACLQRQVKAMRSELGPTRSLVVRYEDVVADPDETRARLAEFLGRRARADLQAAPAGIVLPWESWKREALGPVVRDRVDSWRQSLGDSRAREVAAVCRTGMRDFGYADAPSTGAAFVTLSRLGPRAIARLVSYRRAYEGYLEVIDRRRL
jgi:hypothetical protein